MNADMNGRAVNFIALNALDVDHELLTIHLHNLANLLTFVVTSDDLHFIIFPYRDTAAVVFLSQIFGNGSTHNLSSYV